MEGPPFLLARRGWTLSEKIRIDKLMGQAGLGSRREIGQWIRAGLVAADGCRVRKPAEKVDPKARITIEGRVQSTNAYAYYLMNKPAGVLSASRDRAKTVIDLINKEDLRPGLFPVGRLDKDTTGLLLISNDGRLAHQLLSPRHLVEKTYEALLDQPAEETDVKAFQQGFYLLPEGIMTKPARLILLEAQRVQVTITEGKYHQVKRMFAKVGKEVVALKRIRMGSLSLGDLPEGSYRPLEAEELAALRSLSDGKQEG